MPSRKSSTPSREQVDVAVAATSRPQRFPACAAACSRCSPCCRTWTWGRPTQAAQAVPVLQNSTQTLLKQWEEIQKTDLPQLKSQLGIATLPQVADQAVESVGITTNKDEE